jgi:hypothetical protein
VTTITSGVGERDERKQTPADASKNQNNDIKTGVIARPWDEQDGHLPLGPCGVRWIGGA